MNELICPKCKEEVDPDCFINKAECFEEVGEIWCDYCFEAHCEDEATRDPQGDDHDKYGDPQKED